MTEILPCFYCGKPCRTNRLTGEGSYVECTGENCYSGPILERELPEKCIKRHNFIAKAVLEAEKTENRMYWLGDEPIWYIFDGEKEDAVKSIFDMNQEEIRKFGDDEYIRLVNIDDNITFICNSSNEQENSTHMFSLWENKLNETPYNWNSLKKLIDHQSAYLKQKEKDASKKFRAGWTYKDKDGFDYLILDTDNLQTCYCWNDKSLYLTMHLCLDVFSGRNWGPKE